MPSVIIFILLTLILVVGGKFIFPLIGGAILAAYHGIVAVIFNLLTAIYAIVPGHDFGVALIIFTIIVRMAMWPLVRKQLHQTKVMRKIQPELKKVKEKAKGNKQLESKLMMELYREKGVNPLGSIWVLALQLPILLALYQVVRLITHDKHNVVTHSFKFIQNFGYMKDVTANIDKFNEKLFGSIDLTHMAITNNKVYVPVMIMAVLAAIFQYFQSKQLMPQPKEKKTLRQLFKDAGTGKQADQSEVSAAMSGGMVKIFPLLTFMFAISIQGALTLYLLTSTLVGWGQQTFILGQDVDEMETMTNKKPSAANAERLKKAQEATVVETTSRKPVAKKKVSKKKGK
ncbi:MAG TPA: YidC/Oxa1 family membrane protein insertase [Candidatus Saccharimonadales bacterium]|nr:YidC/Oxa1 family membrane protein insertase [Candidatus Saccharimonadales bacterium]